MREETSVRSVDAVVIGAGFAGLYAIHKLRGMGLSVQAFESGPDVGGTWYWNCYPGARCDVESLDYCYGFDARLLADWKWTERFATQPEVLRYINHVADRFDLRRSIKLDTKVTAATYDEAANRWLVETQDRERLSAAYVISAVGCLSEPNKPDFEGLDDFKGRWFQTCAWPKAGVDLAGKRVGVIGTGSSGIQTIPVIAQEAGHLTVFQRTANFTLPAVNRPIDPDYEAAVRADYLGHRAQILQNRAATVKQTLSASAFDLSEEDRNAAYEAKWRRGGAGGIPVLFPDCLTDPAANATAAEFVRDKIRRIVKDPVTAEALCPKDHPIATKRICLDTDYYETFNRPNVDLVDLKATPIDRITPGGLKTTDRDYPLDVLVFATGFDAVTGALLAIDVRGVGGASLRDVWRDGPRTNLGLMVAGFPNLFTITGPGSPSVLANVIAAIEQHVDWIARCLDYMRANGFDRIDADPQAQDAWAVEVQKVADGTLFPLANSWYNGDNIPGKPRVFLAYVGGYPAYAARCEEVAAAGYEGFTLSRAA
jgi:cation diffusion facilitator CzcD-associated flavoprotein CzcO